MAQCKYSGLFSPERRMPENNEDESFNQTLQNGQQRQRWALQAAAQNRRKP
jgi:hypothetical protein